MRRLRLVVMVLCALTSLGGRAQAAPIAWLGPACAASKARFEARLAALASPGELARISGKVSTRSRRGRLSLRLELILADRALGERRFEVKSCDEAAELAAVVIAMTAAPNEQNPTPQDEAPAVEAAPVTDPESDSKAVASSRQPSAARGHDWETRFGLLVSSDLGVFPKPAWAVTTELAVGTRSGWAIAALFSASLRQERAIGESKLIRLSLVSAILRGCVAVLSRDTLGLKACAGIESLWTHGEGLGFDVNHSAGFVQLGPHAAADFSLEAPRHLEWHAELGASLPLTRPRFLAEQREVSRTWPLVAAARLGPVVRF